MVCSELFTYLPFHRVLVARYSRSPRSPPCSPRKAKASRSPKARTSSKVTTTPPRGVWLKNETDHDLDIWINGGGPVAGVEAGSKQRLRMPHVDPSTTRGGCKWSATATVHTAQGLQILPICSGEMPSLWHMRHTVICTGAAQVNVLTVIATVSMQRRWREKQRQRALVRAALRRSSATRLQAAARGRIARRLAQCFICLQDLPFPAMVSTHNARCHRICQGCARSYIDSAIEEGKLYIRCPGQSCRNLMDPERFASNEAKATYRSNMRATMSKRFDGESDSAFVGFCREHTRMCPACGVVIWRYAGCNHMSCRCGNEFDWGAADARVVVAAPGQPSPHFSPQSGVTNQQEPPDELAARPQPAAGSHHTTSGQTSSQIVLAFQQLPHNDTCFDCGAPSPRWTSLTHGTAICFECAGAHRSLGVNTSFVRSFALDAFSVEESRTLLQSGGNGAFQHFLQAQHERYNRVWAALSIAERYQTAAARQYRMRLRNLREDISADATVAEAAGVHLDEGHSALGANVGVQQEIPILSLSAISLAEDGQRARAQVNMHEPPALGPRRLTAQEMRGWESGGDDVWDIDGLSRETVARLLEGQERLELMGFDPHTAMGVLRRHNGDVQRAALSLME
eukprot:CAMPEP_0174719780 /NCGR_PEP_ID=MMETSP1094-20130205/31957_1 /TAXON_ID=156173 /ORGANISM="Chrysochromulina brevifilum, Strain UTEX LB 985" /LENGTH=626 /DNA_ID=CAMNT_0015920149 /DNA_START=125 /DNA_END=2005 /DNA_ORIENTATION=+